MSGIIKLSRNTATAPYDLAATQTVAFSHYNNISAQLPIDVKSGKIVVGGIKEQATQCLKNIKAIVESIDHAMHDVVKINVYLKNICDLDSVDDVYATFFPHYLPTRTVISVAALPMNGALIQMDAVISNGEGSGTQAPCDLVKIVRNTVNAPNSHISTHTVAFSHYNHISAQLPLDPKTGNIVVGGVKEQTRQCLKNIKSILEAIDVPVDDIVKINIYIENLADIDAINEVYSCYFPDSGIARTLGYMPARSVIAVEGLPMGALVQIDATVSHGDGTPPQAVEDRHGLVIRAHNTDNAPQTALSSQTVAFSHYNNISGQLPLNSMTGQIVDGGVNEQARQCLANIKAIVESVNHVMDDIVKVNIQLKNIEDLDAVNDVYMTFFNEQLPARTVIGVSTIAMSALVQMDAIVSNGEGTPPVV
ncbi:reactive intermediate/imine deaminase [Photobacterium phosphoreum]|uniref:Reactive intermediate/imine deaminase n=1 Tax=Photobacterium phosphoreum TaxID=659 RepID=A0A2T3JEG5_PHOPO|nr:RidA family protein [Photobacterium phosphoreum]PSU21080.1 reactive intermediate/imine deaminase [Photobacterium phosphoreum]PSU39679.1 reactive intermediate/imine deaminase [Photobacterium phosphoreum]PSU47298.1 reactive intermediate/imine deaminase [Photobacterium phosphoreum]